jgi:putative endonuclease
VGGRLADGKGYRILAFRWKAPLAEIDVVAKRGRVLAVVEVKSRTTLEVALETVSYDQRDRLRRAGAQLAATRPALAGCDVRLDLLALAPGRLPRHIPDAWKGA